MTRTDLKQIYGNLYPLLTPGEKRYLTDRYPQRYEGLGKPKKTAKYQEWHIIWMELDEINVMLARRAGIVDVISEKDFEKIKGDLENEDFVQATDVIQATVKGELQEESVSIA